MGILEYDGTASSGAAGNTSLSDSTIERALDTAGNPAPRAKRYVYHYGTDNLAAIFEDTDLTVSTANPMVADENGYFSTCSVVEGLYTVVVEDENGALLASFENVAVKGGADVGVVRGFRQLSQLLDNTTLSYNTTFWRDRAVENDILDIAETGQRYSIAPSGATEFDYQTAGGVKLIDLGRRSARAAGAAATNPDGTIVQMDGLTYITDNAATGEESATHDLGVDGLRPFGLVRPAHYGDELHRAIANTTSGEIYLPADTITVDTLHLQRNVSIFGQGRKKTILKVTGHTTYDGVDAAIVASGENESGLSAQMRINGIEVDASGLPAGTNGLLVMRKLNMNEVFIHEAPGHGIILRSGIPNEQAVYFADFQNVWSKRNGGSGLRITDNSNANKFELCQFDGNGAHGVHQILVGLPGVNQAIYSNIFVGGQASYNQNHGIYLQNGANIQIFGTYTEYNSAADSGNNPGQTGNQGNPKVGAFNNLHLGPTVARVHALLGEQGTDVDIEDTIGLNSVATNHVSVGGLLLTPSPDLSLGYANAGSGRTIKLQGAGGCEHTVEFHEGVGGAVARLRYNGVPGSPGNQIRMEVTSDQGASWQTLWHGTNNGRLSVFGETPVAQGTLAADATDLASAIALANNLKELVKDFGIGA